MKWGLPGRLKRKPKDTAYPSATPSLTPPPSSTSKVSRPTLVDADIEGEIRIEVARKPTAREEKDVLENKHQRDRNRSYKQDMRERKRFAENAYGITQTWVGFLMVLTFSQFSLKSIGLGLSDTAFVTVFTTTTASVFGFWLLVGRYLFPGDRNSE